MAGDIYCASVQNKTQADGAQTVTLEEADRFREHQVQLEVSATPSAGSLTVAVRTPGASGFTDIGTIDMTDTDDYLQQFTGLAGAVRFTPSGFDADKTYSVFLAGGAGV